jgi:hypothetical protein
MGPWGDFDPSSHNDPANLVSEREANVQTADTRGAITAVSDVDMEATDTGAHGQHVLNDCCASEEEGLDDLSQIRVQIQDIENQGDMANRITDPDTGSQIPLEGPKRNTGDRREGPDRNNLAPGSSSPQTDPGCG